MALIKCSECGNMVSDKANSCPHCGCPIEYLCGVQDDFEKELDEDVVEIFELISEEDHLIAFEKADSTYAMYFGTYLEIADTAYDVALTMYKKAGNIVNVLATVPNLIDGTVEKVLDLTVKNLYDCGIMTTPDQFYQKYNLDVSSYGLKTQRKYEEILNLQDSLANERALEKASRSRWQGGGFGLKGAIKGAFTAAALNAGSDFLHSFGDNAKVSNDKKIIRKKLSDLYDYQSTRDDLCFFIKKFILQVFEAFISELVANGQISISEYVEDISHEKANEIFDATMKYETDKNKLKENMITCIYTYPGDIRYYEPIYDELIKRDNDFLKFIKFWHIEHLFKEIKAEKEAFIIYEEARKRFHMDTFDFSDLSINNALKIFEMMEWCYEQGATKIPATGEYIGRIRRYLKHVGSKNGSNVGKDFRLLDLMHEDTPDKFISRYYSYLELMEKQGLLSCAMLANTSYWVTKFIDSDNEEFVLSMSNYADSDGFLLTTKRLIILNDKKVYNPSEILTFGDFIKNGKLYTEVTDSVNSSYIGTGYAAEVLNPVIALLIKAYKNNHFAQERDSLIKRANETEIVLEDDGLIGYMGADEYYESKQYASSAFEDFSKENAKKIIKDYITYLALYFDRHTLAVWTEWRDSTYRGKIDEYIRKVDKSIIEDEDLYRLVPGKAILLNYVYAMHEVLEYFNDYFGHYSGNQELDDTDHVDKKVIKYLLKLPDDDNELFLYNGAVEDFFKVKGFAMTTKRIFDVASGKDILYSDITNIKVLDEKNILIESTKGNLPIISFCTDTRYSLDNRTPALNKNESVVKFLTAVVEKACNKSMVTQSKEQTVSEPIENIVSDNMFCVHCGKQILRSAKFCNFCGKANNYGK